MIEIIEKKSKFLGYTYKVTTEAEVKEILAKNREFLEKIASKLLEKTTIMMSDIQEIKKTCKIVR